MIEIMNYIGQINGNVWNTESSTDYPFKITTMKKYKDTFLNKNYYKVSGQCSIKINVS